ncbi:hypothetical protein ACOMHN_006629 [Nucella lapillus]
MATPMPRRGEPRGLLGWPQNPPALTNQSLRLCVKVNARGRSQLDLSHRGVTVIPHQVFQFQQLDVLNLSHNRIDHLPPTISYLRGIRTLHLQHNLLTALPPTLVNCRQLSELDLTNNRLSSLPRGIGALTGLRVLNVGENQLEQVPHELGALSNLRVLDLHGNRLWYVPFSLQNLYRLLRMDLSDNLFDQIPLVVTKLTWVHALDLSKNRLASLPPDFDQMRELRELNLSENRFVALGVMATKLRQLKYLSLSHNRLQYLPEQVSQLKNLRVLHLQDNRLTTLPDTFPNLRYLNAAHNHLRDLSVLRAPQLVALDASANQLEALPRGVFLLKRLARLNMSQNRIVDVPEDVGWLKKLQSLDMSENRLRSLPASLHFLEKLTSFNVQGNPQLSRVPLTSATTTTTMQDGEKKRGKKAGERRGTGKSKRSKHQEEKTKQKQKKAKRQLLRQYSSMPSLHHASSSKTDLPPDMPLRSMLSSDWQGGDAGDLDLDPDPSPQERTWLDNFLLSKPRRRASWEGNVTPRTVRSVPYATDEFYDTGEISASFSAESLEEDKHKQPDALDPLTTLSFRSDDQDSALEASFSSDEEDLNPKHHHHHHHHLPNHHHHNHHAWELNHHHHHTQTETTHQRKNHTSGRKSAPVTLEDQTLKKTPFQSWSRAEREKDIQTVKDVQSGNNVHTEKKVPYTPVPPHLEYYDYRDSERGGWDVRPMNVLLTNASSQPNSQAGTLRGCSSSRRTPASHQRGAHIINNNARSDSNWTILRSGQPPDDEEPLTVHTWTQTPDMAAPAGSRGRGGGHARSADYTLLGVCSQIQTQLHRDLLQPVIGYNGHHPGRFSTKTIQPGHNGVWHWGQHPTQGTGPSRHGAELISPQGAGLSPQGAEPSRLEAGLEFSPGETFITTKHGGHYISAFCPHLQVSVPPGAVEQTMHVTLQQLIISHHVLKTIGKADSYVSNLISVGPIIFLHALEKVTFASPVTLTLPAPVKVRGDQGHLVVVSVRADNTCVPCTTGYQSSQREVTLTTWHMTGKVAVLSKAKCKYKACKSVEQLLATLNLLSRSAPHLHP